MFCLKCVLFNLVHILGNSLCHCPQNSISNYFWHLDVRTRASVWPNGHVFFLRLSIKNGELWSWTSSFVSVSWFFYLHLYCLYWLLSHLCLNYHVSFVFIVLHFYLLSYIYLCCPVSFSVVSCLSGLFNDGAFCPCCVFVTHQAVLHLFVLNSSSEYRCSWLIIHLYISISLID